MAMHPGSRAFAAFLLEAALLGVAGCGRSGNPSDGAPAPGAVDAPAAPSRERGGTDSGDRSTAAPSSALAGGSMSGRVLDADGLPLEGATVELHTDWMTEEERSAIRGATSTTDSSGRYRIEGLREHPGHRLLVKHERHALGWLYFIDVKENANTENPVIRLEKGRSIRGRVVDRAGRPVAGARIDAVVGSRYIDVIDPLETMARLETRSYTTEADGKYEIPCLAALRYDVHASKEGFITAEVDVRLGQTGTTDAPDVVLEESIRLSIKVKDRAGHPIEDAAVLLDVGGVLRTDANGVLVVADLQALPDELEVSAPGYAARTVESPGPEVEVVLEREQP